jgi:hypothetical protein
MDLDDVVDPKVGVAAAAVAVAVSPPVRAAVHRGLVYAVTGALMVTSSVAALGRGVGRGFRAESRSLRGNGDGRKKRLRNSSSTESHAEEGQ